MATQLITQDSIRASREFSAGASALLILLLTSVHHIWGAIVFDTPWRLHIVFISLPVAMVIVALLYVARSDSDWSASARWAAAAIIFVFPIAMIGVYEGGFNHVMKNLIFFASGEASTRGVFASETYEMPSDIIFEVTGVLQFPAAVYALRKLIALVRRNS